MHAPQEHEQLLLQQMQGGSERAYAELYRRYASELYWKLRQMVRGAEEADELLQDLFVKVWERRDQVDLDQSFGAFLYRIAKNMAVDHFRKLAREAKLYEGFRTSSTELDSTTEDTVIANETNRLLQKAIDQLPPQRRQAFVLCKIDGKTHQQAAELMGISHNTVHNHLVKATSTIKEYLQKSNGELAPLVVFFASLLLET